MLTTASPAFRSVCAPGAWRAEHAAAPTRERTDELVARLGLALAFAAERRYFGQSRDSTDERRSAGRRDPHSG